MREQASLRVVSEQEAAPAERRVVAFTSDEKRQVFKAMVVGELEAGFLRYSRRLELMRYAGKLQIPEFEATLLIAEAQYYSADIQPVRMADVTALEPELSAHAWSVPTRLAFALTIAIFIDLLLIAWLF